MFQAKYLNNYVCVSSVVFVYLTERSFWGGVGEGVQSLPPRIGTLVSWFAHPCRVFDVYMCCHLQAQVLRQSDVSSMQSKRTSYRQA